MIRLEEIERSMQTQVERIRSTYGHRAASHGFASLYIWKEEMGLRICLKEDVFALKFGLRGEHAWFYPCGEPEAVKELIAQILREDGEAVFYYMMEQDAAFLAREFPDRFWIRECDNDSEYLYDRWQQQELKGKKFSGQRNHINRIKADYKLSVETLDEQNLWDAIKVNQCWERRSSQDAGLRDEQAGRLLLENREGFGGFGILVRVDDRPYAIAAGYPLCEDVFDLALVKQVECLTGLSVYARNQLIRLLPEKYKWINAEEDLGVEGLRTMKKQMKPVALIKMYQGAFHSQSHKMMENENEGNGSGSDN